MIVLYGSYISLSFCEGP